jgi:hypothetical protein
MTFYSKQLSGIINTVVILVQHLTASTSGKAKKIKLLSLNALSIFSNYDLYASFA